MNIKIKFPIYLQLDSSDCGVACLRMIAKSYGKSIRTQTLSKKSNITREGVSLLGISDVAESIGMHTIAVKTSIDKLAKENTFPFIAHWKQNHFVVVYKIKGNTIYVADPARGKINYSKEEFHSNWSVENREGKSLGVALLLEPTPDFYNQSNEKIDKSKFSFIFNYLKPHKQLISQLIIGLVLSSLLLLIFPFLTQSIVDIGIANNNLVFINLILVAQLVLFTSRTMIDFVRSWILLHIGTRVNISLISDFLIKLMRLPISYFDTKLTGDLIQRIGDHKRIETFLTGYALNFLFSSFNLLVFSVVLSFYSIKIFTIFILGSFLYVIWVGIFMKRRRAIDNKRFQEAANERSSIIQLIQGMQEIKLQNAEKYFRWGWENIQTKLFKIQLKGLALSQYQRSGTLFINETKNIIISFISAYLVIKGEMTLGMMLAVQYIIGQLNSPIDQFIGFANAYQDAKLSIERMGEIHGNEDEEEENKYIQKMYDFSSGKTISTNGIKFRYDKPYGDLAINNIDLIIPNNKITAIVGTSGSGKTTLIKLMLGFYNVDEGEIRIGENQIQTYSQSWWRKQVGTVMQDGFIFNDTIARNISVGDEIIDQGKLVQSTKIANIDEFINNLPLGFSTKIGIEGNGLSQGQKQRILIARAVYKNPDYLFFDEATNALDANNELIIMKNLDEFFKGKTVLIVAHRLSTVKKADQIIVLEKGKVVEIGNHKTLTSKKGAYFHLVKNQLELGN